jgi:hypothetical protein
MAKQEMKPIEVFFSYAHEDEPLMDEVRRQLVVFEREGRIIKWHDRMIPPGTEWEAQIDGRLRRANVILLFVSPDFLESRYCYDVEVAAALERHTRGEARVIPIILRPCAWDVAPFASLQALPRDAKPITQWRDRDQVCLDVARGVIEVVDDIRAGSVSGTTKSRGPERKRYAGDRIDRIVVPFTPPRGINIPPGYQPRLNQIAAEVARDSAVRDANGGYAYPIQVTGPANEVQEFMRRVGSNATIADAGFDESKDPAEGWFEYKGDLSPNEMRDLALATGLKVVHCGVTLVGRPGGRNVEFSLTRPCSSHAGSFEVPAP